MELSVLTLLGNVPNYPADLRFNEFGVALNTEIISFESGGLKIVFKVARVNGMWGGEKDVSFKTWGCGSPLMQGSFIHPTKNACIENLWDSLLTMLKRDVDAWNKAFKLYSKWKKNAEK